MSRCSIWEAASATSAAPFYFEPVKLSGRTFCDGGMGLNNPTLEAYKEVDQMTRRAPCLVLSLGSMTGSDKSRKGMTTISKEKTWEVGLGGYVRFIHQITSTLTETWKAEEDMAFISGKTGVDYFRFNVPQTEIKLDEWQRKRKTASRIAELTRAYLLSPEVQASMSACAESLVKNRRRKL